MRFNVKQTAIFTIHSFQMRARLEWLFLNGLQWWCMRLVRTFATSYFIHTCIIITHAHAFVLTISTLCVAVKRAHTSSQIERKRKKSRKTMKSKINAFASSLCNINAHCNTHDLLYFDYSSHARSPSFFGVIQHGLANEALNACKSDRIYRAPRQDGLVNFFRCHVRQSSFTTTTILMRKIIVIQYFALIFCAYFSLNIYL